MTAGATNRLGLTGIDTAVESKAVDTETVTGEGLGSGPGTDTAVRGTETVVVAAGVVNTELAELEATVATTGVKK